MICGIILAAGRGSRLGSITQNSHKSLIKFDKTNLMENILQNYKKNQIEKVCFVTGYNHNLFKKYKIKKFFNKYWKNTNMVYSLMMADSWLSKYTCIVTYSDIYYNSKAIKLLKNSKNNFVILNNKNWLSNWKSRYKNPLMDAESFKTDKKKFLIEIGKKEKSVKNINGQYMGLMKITPHTWKKIKLKLPEVKKKNKVSITELLNKLIIFNFKIKTVIYKHKWFEIDNKKDLSFFLNNFK